MGGSNERELTALAVTPNLLPPCWVVMTVTPLVKWLMTLRKSTELIGPRTFVSVIVMVFLSVVRV
jgi:hypothetical protein